MLSSFPCTLGRIASKESDAILPKVHGKDESILETSYEFGAQVLDEVIQKNCLKEERKGDKK